MVLSMAVVGAWLGKESDVTLPIHSKGLLQSQSNKGRNEGRGLHAGSKYQNAGSRQNPDVICKETPRE